MGCSGDGEEELCLMGGERSCHRVPHLPCLGSAAGLASRGAFNQKQRLGRPKHKFCSSFPSLVALNRDTVCQKRFASVGCQDPSVYLGKLQQDVLPL